MKRLLLIALLSFLPVAAVAEPVVNWVIGTDEIYPSVTTNISVSAEDNEAYFLTDVYVYVSGPGLPSGWNLVHQEYIGNDTMASFSFDWTAPTTGTFWVTAEAYNDWGDVSSFNPEDSFTIHPNRYPSASTSAPTEADAGSTVNVGASASDPDNNLFSVSIRWFGHGLQHNWQFPATGSYSNSLNLTAPTNGELTMDVRTEAMDTEQLAVADSWQTINVVYTPFIDWSDPAPIEEGTALSSTQLNAVARKPFDSAPVNANYVYSPASGTVLAAGTHTLNVTAYPQGSDADHFHVVSGSVTLQVNPPKQDQTITFDPIPDKSSDDPDFGLSASASSGLPVSFSVDFGPATVSGSTVSLTGGTGTVTIRASQSGNESYNPAPDETESFTVKHDQTISFSSIPDKSSSDPSFSLSASASSGLSVSFVVTSGPASVSGSTVTLSGGTGTVTIRAFQGGDSSYWPAPDEYQSFTVKHDQTISFEPIPDKQATDPPFNVTATASSGLGVTFSVVTGPATISGNTVTLTGGTGTVTIRASQGGDGTYWAAPDVDESFAVSSPNNAQFVEAESTLVPAEMIPNETVSVTIKFQNTGTTTWSTDTSPHKLGSQNPADNTTWGLSRVALTGSETIASAEFKTFTFNVTAPATSGYYDFQWQMIEETVGWFGEKTPNIRVTVSDPAAPDTDGDGMADWWEDAHSFDKNNAADASQDADSDGLTNLQEFLLGTDPRTAAQTDSSNQTELNVHTPTP